jgi:uncharacterized membrane protein YhaH (DUF805 family)
MRKRENFFKWFLWWIVLILSIFFVSFEALHTEKSLDTDHNCPICVFEKTTILFVASGLVTALFIFLFHLLYTLFFKENINGTIQYFHPFCQRAPPRYSFLILI